MVGMFPQGGDTALEAALPADNAQLNQLIAMEMVAILRWSYGGLGKSSNSELSLKSKKNIVCIL